MIKKLCLSILDIVVRLYPLKFKDKLEYYRAVIHNHWIKRYLGHLGNKSGVGFGCQLQGEGNKNIYIGNNTGIGKYVILGCWKHFLDKDYEPKIVIGDYTNIGDYTQISAANKVIIGNGVLTGRYVYISDNNHGSSDFAELHIRPNQRNLYIKGPVVIGDNVWIGDKVSILSGVTIGEGSIIGCNAVVTHDIPPYSVVGGVPAKIIKSVK